MTRSEADDEKQARLAAALRENLKRRKAQARGRRSEDGRQQQPAAPAQGDDRRT